MVVTRKATFYLKEQSVLIMCFESFSFVLSSAMRGGAGRGRGRGRGGRGQARGQNRRGRGRGGRFHSGPDDPVAEESRGKNGGKSEGSDNSDEDDDAPPAEIAISHSHSPDGMEEKESKKLERSDADEENGRLFQS